MIRRRAIYARDPVPVLSFGQPVADDPSVMGVELCFPIVVGTAQLAEIQSSLLKAHQTMRKPFPHSASIRLR